MRGDDQTSGGNPGPATDRRGLLTVVWVAGVLPGLTALAVWALRMQQPLPVAIIQAAFPWWIVPTTLALLGALATRRWRAVALALPVLVAQVFAVAPAVGGEEPPVWSDDAPTVTVASANAYFINPDHAAAARTLLDADADLVAVQEFTPHFRDAAMAVGLWDAYPHRVARSQYSPAGGLLLSRLPFAGEPEVFTFDSSTQIRARVRVGEQVLTVMAVHPHAPGRGAMTSWVRHADMLREEMTGLDGPAVVTGDFNSGRWHTGFRNLLDDGWRSAHETAGAGLTMSWPLGKGFPPFTRLDHALFRGEVAPTELRNLEVPGSDHLAFVATFAVRQG